MNEEAIGREYQDKEIIIRQGEIGTCMFVIQAGEVEIYREENGQEVRLNVFGPKDFFGEMAIVENAARSASARALGKATILTIDRRTFLRRVHEDPSLAYRIMEAMSLRIRKLAEQVAILKAGGTPLPSRGDTRAGW